MKWIHNLHEACLQRIISTTSIEKRRHCEGLKNGLLSYMYVYMCSHIHVCRCLCIWLYMCVHAYRAQRTNSGVVLRSYTCFFQSLLRLSQGVPGGSVPWPPQCWDCKHMPECWSLFARLWWSGLAPGTPRQALCSPALYSQPRELLSDRFLVGSCPVCRLSQKLAAGFLFGLFCERVIVFSHF